MQAEGREALTPSGKAAPSGSRRYILLFLLVAILVATVDVTAKILAVAKLSDGHSVQVLGTFFQLTLLRNPGAAFSTGTSYTVVLSVIAVAAVAVVLFYARRLRSGLWAVGLGLLLGGVTGNLSDRVFREPGFLRGHVVDYLHLTHWPVFNVADVCIDLAGVIIVLQAIRGIGVSGRGHSGHAVGAQEPGGE